MTDESREALRRRFRAAVAAMPPAQRMQAGVRVAAQLEQSGWIRPGATVAGYWSLPREVPMLLVQMLVTRLGARYCLPMLDADGTLRFGVFRAGDDIRLNRFGIPEPATPTEVLAAGDLDLVLMPLTAFDRGGNRLGTGGGWYDRTFAALTGDRPRRVGIAFACQEHPALPAEPWDVALHAVATDAGWHDCR